MTNTQRGEETGGNCIFGKWNQTSGVEKKRTVWGSGAENSECE